MKYKCICCGFITMDNEDPLYYDICSVCFWENDPIQNENPDYSGGANVVSLKQAKKNFALFGAAEERVLKYVRKPLPDEFPE